MRVISKNIRVLLNIRSALFLFILLLISNFTTAEIPTPQSHFGFKPGEDYKLFKYEPMIEYLKKLESTSEKVAIEKIGYSEMGRPMYSVFVSSSENISKLEDLKSINRELALNGNLTPERQDSLINQGRVFVLLAMSMHATEVGPAQVTPDIVYELITSGHPNTQKILENTVCMIVPSHNPDGMNMIIEHYNKYKDTPYEGSSMPGVYHKYVGHNINRDFITLTQSENQAVAGLYNTEWFPQVMVEKHQMGSTGPRYFVSPPHDPIAENVDAGIWNWMRVFGSRSLTEMTEAGLTGISVNYLFDDYWPGATTTSIWKGVIGMLSEAAGVNTASPIYVEPSELRTIGKGLGEYAISINFPKPWPGGWWRLADILEYEKQNTFSYLHTAAIHREEILKFRNEYCKREINRGKTKPPFYYIMPEKQHDQSELVELVNLLNKHGIKTYRLKEDLLVENNMYKTGDLVVPLAQPFRAFIKEIMEEQKFPARHYTPGGELIRPYDITTWSLPLHKGVKADEINTRNIDLEAAIEEIIMPYSLQTEKPGEYSKVLLSSTNNESFKGAFLAMQEGLNVYRTVEEIEYDNNVYPAGSFIIEKHRKLDNVLNNLKTSPVFIGQDKNFDEQQITMPRIALIESWFHDMDGGWTRYLFDTYNIPYEVLRPEDVKEANLTRNFDVIIFSDENKSVLLSGKYERNGSPVISRYPPQYAKGMGNEGLENILAFIDNGGKVVAWRRASEMFFGALSIGKDDEKQEFQLPVRDISNGLERNGLYIPGSLLRTEIRKDHPVTFGMPEEIGVFHRGSPVFATSIPYFDMDRRVIANFAKDNILMSGYAEKEELLAEQTAAVWLAKGKGQLVLFTFNPQFRASTPVTYKLLFNSLLLE